MALIQKSSIRRKQKNEKIEIHIHNDVSDEFQKKIIHEFNQLKKIMALSAAELKVKLDALQVTVDDKQAKIDGSNSSR